MAKINILPPQVYNRIAAGEVVDRPYSVVKELVENALDAGASEIEIQVESGGKGLVCVTDNGCGIEREDLQSAFLPHATSKISRAEDLDCVLTLGFRGEAVASIAAVSKMTITSKTENGKCYTLSSIGGTLGEIREAAGQKGTEVRVEELFFNAPVRLKFLKSDRAEEADITTFISRFILSRPDVAFSYYVNGKSVLQSYGEGEEAAFACVYGASTLANCYRIEAERHGIKIRGFIGNQNFTKPNKSYQTVFLNGRYIANQTVASAISNAYGNYLMKRQYPFYILHIEVPPEIVDVNVHPNKADVRFSDNKIIYGCIYRVVSEILDGNAKALEYIVDKDRTEENIEKIPSRVPSSGEEVSRFMQEPLSYDEARKAMAEMSEIPSKKQGTQEMELPFPTLDEEPYVPFGKRTGIAEEKKAEGGVSFGDLIGENAKNSDAVQVDKKEENSQGKAKKAEKNSLREMFSDLYFEPSVFTVNQPRVQEENAKEESKDCRTTSSDFRSNAFENTADTAYDTSNAKAREKSAESEEGDFFEENRRFLLEKERAAKQERVDVSSFSYAGKLFNTYLLYEHGDEVYLIDQHAAHERLIFNRLTEKMRARKAACQTMLVPYSISLNAFEGAFLRENLHYIADMGFDIAENGENVFEVYGVPADLTQIDLPSFFHDILSEVGGYRAIKLEDLLRDKLATAACKAAVKGGDDLSQAEIDELFRLIDGNLGLKCPHGRPVVAKMTKYELEKMFKRVV